MLSIITFKTDKKVVCYYRTQAVHRPSNGKFEASDIDPFLCTHLIYAFFEIEQHGELRVIDPAFDLVENSGKGNIKQVNNLKKINPELKTLAAVGGWFLVSYNFSQVAKDSGKRSHFIETTIEFLKKHNFDGLDINWEFPGERGGDPQVYKTNFAIFIRELKEEFSKYNLLLTATVAAPEPSAKYSYDIPEISKYLNFINLEAYNFHHPYENTVGMNAPLYKSPIDKTPRQKQLNVIASVNYWLSQGAPANKIILGIPLFGRTFTLEDSSHNITGSRIMGLGKPGKYTKKRGLIGYNEICENLKTENWTVFKYNPDMIYAVRGNQWISYDDKWNIKSKVEYANTTNLGGIMVWSIDTDDFRGICGPKYPLMKSIKETLQTKAFSWNSTFMNITDPTFYLPIPPETESNIFYIPSLIMSFIGFL